MSGACEAQKMVSDPLELQMVVNHCVHSPVIITRIKPRSSVRAGPPEGL